MLISVDQPSVRLTIVAYLDGVPRPPNKFKRIRLRGTSRESIVGICEALDTECPCTLGRKPNKREQITYTREAYRMLPGLPKFILIPWSDDDERKPEAEEDLSGRGI